MSVWAVAVCAALLWVKVGNATEEVKAVGVVSEEAAKAEKVFAKVGDDVVSVKSFLEMYRKDGRTKYYHGVPPADEEAKMRREFGEQLVTTVLLNQEAKRRNLEINMEKIQANLDKFEKRYGAREDWKKIRDQVLPGIRSGLEASERRALLEKMVRDQVPQQPSEAELMAYYESHKELFTEPENVHVRMILLTVDPSSTSDAWEKAAVEAQDIVKRVQNGADFAELAKLHSGDEASAEDGGDLGYLHKGMLPDASQKQLDKLQPGQVSEAFRGLEGVYVLRLEDRKESHLRQIDEVKERVADLWRRENADQAWKAFVAELRAKTPVTIDESVYLPLPEQDDAAQVK